MSIPFGPRLIGETEKTLNALLRHCLADTGLTEPQWVTLQLAGELDGSAGATGLAVAAADRAHFANAAEIVESLTGRDLLADGRLTPVARDLVGRVRARITAEAGRIWQGLSEGDVATAGRVLNEVVTRARVVLAGGVHMSTTPEARNKATLRRLNDAVETRDAERISTMFDEVFDPDVQVRTPLPVEATGVQAQKEVVAMLLRAFPDLHITIEDMIAEGDKVVISNTVTGTNEGEYMGRPPTGKFVTYKEIMVCRFAGGRIAETWGVVDALSQMRQLGVL